ncbi:hypothetical protein PCANC_10156 [Puccinia coronata f. sp. avenae]|uniref:Uncharacterized protein n=1 Tax=Puccinia coronata f. sp. avenae TaxID=200324 RepID=A0A2N5V6K6_9BASI|nr:hypothetical protein PCANC_10156 [Puccinia coronata f. sp. avenae]
MPMTPQPAVRPVDALGAAANALPSIPPQAKKRDNSPEMGSEEARLALMISKTSGPQRPGGNNPVPPINTLKEQAQIALVMLNTHYNSYVGANNCHHLAIAEMHLRQCIAAQETLCSQVGDAMTITLSQGWSAKYQLSKLKEWMRQHLPQAANHPVQSFTTTNADQGYHPQTTHANSTPYPQPNIAPGLYPQTPVSSQLNQQVNPAPKYCPRAPMPNQAAEAPPAPPFQGTYAQEYNQHCPQQRTNARGDCGSYNSNANVHSLDQGLERMMATAEFLQRASAFMDRRGRSKSGRSNRRRR